MWSLMAACDVLVNLRYPTMGETSGSVIRALSLGKPLIVSDVGWFSELPDDAVLKVPVDEFEVATLEAALGFAVDHGASLGAAARAYVEREHCPRPRRRRVCRGARDGCGRRRGRRRRALADRRGGGRGRHRRRAARSRVPPSTPGSSRERGRARLAAPRPGVWLRDRRRLDRRAHRCSRAAWPRRGSWSTS